MITGISEYVLDRDLNSLGINELICAYLNRISRALRDHSFVPSPILNRIGVMGHHMMTTGGVASAITPVVDSINLLRYRSGEEKRTWVLFSPNWKDLVEGDCYGAVGGIVYTFSQLCDVFHGVFEMELSKVRAESLESEFYRIVCRSDFAYQLDSRQWSLLQRHPFGYNGLDECYKYKLMPPFPGAFGRSAP